MAGQPRPGLPSRGPHVFVPPVSDRRELVADGDTGHHLAAVLRVRTDDPVSLADDTGWVYQAVVRTVGGREVTLEIIDRFAIPAAAPRVTVVQALAKGNKMAEVIQRLSEVGVDRLVPVRTARAVKQVPGQKAQAVRRRWQAVALAAAQQSRRARLLAIDPVTTWPVPHLKAGVVLYEQADQPLSRTLADLPPEGDGVVLAIGPEGGWEPDEVSASGLRPAALGKTILRTETAGLVAASLVLHHYGRLG